MTPPEAAACPAWHAALAPPDAEVPLVAQAALAGFWRRLLASLIDQAIVVAVLLALASLFVYPGWFSPIRGDDIDVIVAASVLLFELFLVLVFVLPILLALLGILDASGGSPGKRLLGTRVVSVKGSTARIGLCIGRRLVAAMLGGFVIANAARLSGQVLRLGEGWNWGLGYLAAVALIYGWALRDTGRQALHDKVFRSYVVKTRAHRT